MEYQHDDSYVTYILPRASSGAWLHLGFIQDNVGFFWSTMDYLFAQFVTTTSYISCRFLQFVDDLIMQDVWRSSEGLRVFTSYEHGTTSEMLDKEVSENKEGVLVNKKFHLVGLTSHIPGINLVFKGVISRVRITLNGSSGDIGWLQDTPGFPHVEDGTTRFRELLENIRVIFVHSEDLTYERRREFIMKNKLPDSIPLISFHSEASIAPGVLATLTQIAHADLPWLSFPNFSNDETNDSTQTIRKVPVVMPVSAAMAVCALHLQLLYGEKSDGLVTCRDAEVPGSVVVRPDKKLDHARMVYSSWNKNASELDCCEMCEALPTLLVEICENITKMKKRIGFKLQTSLKKSN